MMKNSKFWDLYVIEDHLLTLNKRRTEFGEEEHKCLRFIKSADMLLKGESWNPQSESRYILITGIDMGNDELITKNLIILFKWCFF